ncbi:hypothetical protein EC988_000305 [Linderina pennispora]|nr:hypothetical protein EC988_000305 [Linderina pennispora]
MSAELSTLPDDVLFHVFSFCNGDDISAFSQVCRQFRQVCDDDYLWKQLFLRRFGHAPEGNLGTYKAEYYERERTILSVADDCTIAHNHNPYWQTIDDHRSIFGRVSLLHAVSWLHVFGELHGVHSGTYNVIWRLSVLPRAQHIFDINFRAEANGNITESQLPESANLLDFGSDYFDFVLPEPLVVSKPFEDVAVECRCTTNTWKSNLKLCSVRLEPIDERRRGQRLRWAEQVKRSAQASNGNRPRQIRFLRSRPGASYRLWKPWIQRQWYEAGFIAMFCAMALALFAHILFTHTAK